VCVWKFWPSCCSKSHLFTFKHSSYLQIASKVSCLYHVHEISLTCLHLLSHLSLPLKVKNLINYITKKHIFIYNSCNIFQQLYPMMHIYHGSYVATLIAIYIHTYISLYISLELWCHHHACMHATILTITHI